MAREVACKLSYILCEVRYQAVEGLRATMSRTSTANCGTMLTSSMHSRPYYAIRSSGSAAVSKGVLPMATKDEVSRPDRRQEVIAVPQRLRTQNI